VYVESAYGPRLSPGLQFYMAEFSQLCRYTAAQDDPDRYLATLFAPAVVRPALWALLAFNQEIAKTRETVTETTIGLIRLQWWRDEIAKIYNGHITDGNPVIAGLRMAIENHKLNHEDFDTLIYAREFDLEGVAPANLQGLENYVDYTNTPLNMLIAAVCGQTVDRERVRYLSVAYGLTGLLRSVPFHAHQGRCYLPQEELIKYSITPEQLFECKPLRALQSVVADIAVLADDHLTRATEIGHVRPFRAMRSLTQIYLKQLKAADFDVFSPRLMIPPPFKELRVWMKTI
jgi:NADH dehydrogenase [ubiquinone] 1 alpha subcomplex assembly factor 6